MSLLSNLKKRGLKDIVRPFKWWVFIRYLYNKWFNTTNVIDAETGELSKKTEYSELNIPEYLEQIVYRMNKCKPCLRAGECHHCGCKSPELFYDRTNECSGENWGQMVDPKFWEDHKKTYKLEINPDHVKQVTETGIITKF